MPESLKQPELEVAYTLRKGGLFAGQHPGEHLCSYAAALSIIESLRSQLQEAVGALADIAVSQDMTLEMARKKAARVHAALAASSQGGGNG